MSTIRDVARAANVAPSTVSMVLNRRGSVRPETRDRIFFAAKQLGYRSRPVGRPSEGIRAWNLGVLYSSRFLRDGRIYGVGRRWIAQIRRILLQEHHHLSLFVLGQPEGAAAVDAANLLDEVVSTGELDGFVLIGLDPDEAGVADWLRQRDLPFVVMNRQPEADNYSYVSVDHFGSGYLVARRLMELGHERIAALPPSREQAFQRQRRRGFERGAAAFGVSCVYPTADDTGAPLNIEAWCDEVLGRRGATAVFCTNDLAAVQFIDTVEALGRRVPADVSVVGFDDMGLTSRSGLRPTSVGFDVERMGTAAAEMLLKLLNESDFHAQASLLVSTELREHDTTAPR